MVLRSRFSGYVKSRRNVAQSILAGHATLHGVAIDISVGSRPLGATRSPKADAWWARQDSNLQPDRYERPALTIELQAPPRLPPWGGRQGNGAAPVYRGRAVPAMPRLPVSRSVHRHAGE